MNEYAFEELSIGHRESFTRQVTDEDVLLFSKISGDKNPLHLDEEYAKATEFRRCVAFGMLGSILHSTLAGMYLPGKYSLILKEESSFISPIYSGDSLTITGEISEKKDFGKLLFIETKILNQDNKNVIKGRLVVKVLK
ncbi:MaoC family dehydratase [Candidatus Woesearchaeota archaeon]|nr:MaoC family dehydratase [Candidatus Woesearchaeota archaeon]